MHHSLSRIVLDMGSANEKGRYYGRLLALDEPVPRMNPAYDIAVYHDRILSTTKDVITLK